MLKYFQQEKHYPTNQSAIPESLVISLASQLGIRAQNFIGFDWDADSHMSLKEKLKQLAKS